MTSRYDEIMKNKPYHPFRMGYLTEEMVKRAEEELGETDEIKAKTIPELRKLVENEPNLDSPKDDQYLLQYLRARKFNVKRAFTLLQNYYNVKKNYSDLYSSVDEESLKKPFSSRALSCLPYRDADGCVIYLIRIGNWDSDAIPIQAAVIGLTTNVLFCIEDVATQVCGVRIMCDIQGATFKQIRCVSPRYMTLFSKALRNCLPVRFKGIHIYNESIIFGYLWSVFKFFLSEKIKKRVHFHGDNQKHLHKFIPKAILPAEYGGDYALFMTSNWYINEIETNFFDKYKELIKYGYRN